MIPKKQYIKPEINIINLDNTISLVMGSPLSPQPVGEKGGSKGNDTPFASPFGDKPFN